MVTSDLLVVLKENNKSLSLAKTRNSPRSAVARAGHGAQDAPVRQAERHR